MLEDQRDLEIIDTECDVYTEVELRSNNKIEVDSPIPNLNSNEDSLIQALRESLMITKLPAPKPFIFDGDSLVP